MVSDGGSGRRPSYRWSTSGLRRVAHWCRRPRRWPIVGSARRALLELVFPATCVACEVEINAAGSPESWLLLCDRCLDQLALIDPPTCCRCGAPAPVGLGEVERCVRCDGRKLWFDETIALGAYTGLLRRLLLEMKTARGDATSLALAELAWQRCGGRLAKAAIDLVVPVPMHWRRRLAHGTNSAALLAERLSQRLHVPLGLRVLRRRRNTPPQFSLPPSERWPNVRRAFAARRGYDLSGRHVLLVDDILTTGATCSEAARTLKQTHADRVTVVVAARALTA